jgi:hypothetical protein
MDESEICCFHPAIVSPARPCSRFSTHSHVQRNEVEVGVQPSVTELVTKPGRVQIHGMQYDHSWFFLVESTNIAQRCVGGVPNGCIVFLAVEVDVGHRCGGCLRTFPKWGASVVSETNAITEVIGMGRSNSANVTKNGSFQYKAVI